MLGCWYILAPGKIYIMSSCCVKGCVLRRLGFYVLAFKCSSGKLVECGCLEVCAVGSSHLVGNELGAMRVRKLEMLMM